MSFDLAFIGAGNMAEAIARGLISSGAVPAERIIAADVSDVRREVVEKSLGIRCVTDNVDAARDASAIILAVKPQQMVTALAGIGEVISEKTLVISIAAGINTRFIETNLGLGKHWKVIRTMPNTPMLVGLGAVAISAGAFATKADVTAAGRFFTPAASVVEVTEDKLDAVTAVSGSGPAYFFFLVEQMIAAGVQLGLDEDQARTLATQTALGAAKMLTTSDDSPELLRKKVTSPNGTTHAAISHLEAYNWPTITRDALRAACKRSHELSQS